MDSGWRREEQGAGEQGNEKTAAGANAPAVLFACCENEGSRRNAEKETQILRIVARYRERFARSDNFRVKSPVYGCDPAGGDELLAIPVSLVMWMSASVSGTVPSSA